MLGLCSLGCALKSTRFCGRAFGSKRVPSLIVRPIVRKVQQEVAHSVSLRRNGETPRVHAQESSAFFPVGHRDRAGVESARILVRMFDLWLSVIWTLLITLATILADWIAGRLILLTRGVARIRRAP